MTYPIPRVDRHEPLIALVTIIGVVIAIAFVALLK